MTATPLNGKGSRWTVMGEHSKQVDLSTVTDREKYLVLQQCNVCSIHVYANKFIEKYLLNLLFIWCTLCKEVFKPGGSLLSLYKLLQSNPEAVMLGFGDGISLWERDLTFLISHVYVYLHLANKGIIRMFSYLWLRKIHVISLAIVPSQIFTPEKLHLANPGCFSSLCRSSQFAYIHLKHALFPKSRTEGQLQVTGFFFPLAIATKCQKSFNLKPEGTVIPASSQWNAKLRQVLRMCKCHRDSVLQRSHWQSSDSTAVFCFWFSTNYRQLDIRDLRMRKQTEILHDQLTSPIYKNTAFIYTSLQGQMDGMELEWGASQGSLWAVWYCSTWKPVKYGCDLPLQDAAQRCYQRVLRALFSLYSLNPSA